MTSWKARHFTTKQLDELGREAFKDRRSWALGGRAKPVGMLKKIGEWPALHALADEYDGCAPAPAPLA